MTTPPQVAEPEANHRAASTSGTFFMWLVIVGFTALSLPVIINGAPLSDDFMNCTKGGASGWGDFISQSFDQFGLTRVVGHAVEIGLIGGLCREIPFGVLILVPFVLTLGIAFLIRGLLRDLDVQPPWPEVAAGAWLLLPLGTESALWPSALHLPLGLLFALVSLRLFRRDRLLLAVIFALLAYQCAEQVIFALPFAAWLVSRGGNRLPNAVWAGAAALVTLVAFAVVPGTSFYNDVPLLERVRNVFSDLRYYVELPAVGLGAHSIPQAFLWAFPISLAVLLVGGVIGAVFGPGLFRHPSHAPLPRRSLLLAFVVLIGLVNLPLALSYHPDSPRNFACSWLLIVAFGGAIGPTFSWKRARMVGAAAGLFSAAAFLSLALSSSVRIQSSDVTEAAIATLDTQLQDRSTVAMCDVKRTVVEYAPTGDFAINGFVSFFDDAVLYYTGKRIEFQRNEDLNSEGCPDLIDADVVLDFDEVVEEARTS